ncbi:10134_t:CDS:1, partial [Funneliformis geosporum]
ICFQCGQIPEANDGESNNQVNIEEWHYYYCNECYITVANKKEIGKSN